MKNEFYIAIMERLYGVYGKEQVTVHEVAQHWGRCDNYVRSVIKPKNGFISIPMLAKYEMGE